MNIYISFDGDNDIQYYWMMLAWKNNGSIPLNFINVHNLRDIREDSEEESIKRGLRERMSKADIFILLIGEHTKYLYKYVRWEVELAKEKKLPCIAINLNGKRGADSINCPRLMLETLAVHISFNSRILKYSLDNWPSYVASHPNASGSYHYSEEVYKSLGL